MSLHSIHRRVADFFQLEAHGTTVRREMVGGLTTFLTMSYIIFVQPGLLSQAGMDFRSVLYATCLTAALATFLMGLLANYPVALAPGMGENFFFAYTLCAAAPLGFGLSWQQALAAVFLAGALFVGLTLAGVLTRLVDVIPLSLKVGIAAGIGLLITFIGLQYGNLIVANPATLVQLGDLGHPVSLVSILGLFLMIVLLSFRIRGAILLGILATTGLAAIFGLIEYNGIFTADIDLSATLWQTDFSGLLAANPANVATALFVLFLLGVFDTVGTLVGVGQQAGLLKEGKLPRAGRALFSASTGTTLAGGLGTSTVTCYIESAAGVSDGARTGLANCATGALLLAAMFFSPLASMIGAGVDVTSAAGGPATRYPTLAPALIVVGSMMLRAVRELEWDEPSEYIPAFLVIVGIPLTSSIAHGIALGFVSHAAAKLAIGRGRECHPLTYLFAGLFVIQFLLL